MVERRRRWTNEQKLKILAEALQPGATVSAVADRNGISRSQLCVWMKLAREGRMPDISAGSRPSPLFAPVRIENTPAAATATLASPQPRCPTFRRSRFEYLSNFSAVFSSIWGAHSCLGLTGHLRIDETLSFALPGPHELLCFAIVGNGKSQKCGLLG